MSVAELSIKRPVTAIMFGLAWNLLRGRVGRALAAIRDHPIAAEAMGVNSALYKSAAFGVADEDRDDEWLDDYALAYAKTLGRNILGLLPAAGPMATTWYESEGQRMAVAPGIAEALIATAVGLAAAIPAVVMYNRFARQVRVLTAEMDGFASEFLNIAERHFLSK